ncbi:MAG: hypothetical protein RMH84_01515 [Sulfolobales archaeon]|nr:hypothetical protein [Sulfolobales archaeon]MCX8208243.1 hypothetical protein [Sulfolobales archaeon]MDW8010262.1 hypothetical protein [Sulfolobales archaeon]
MKIPLILVLYGLLLVASVPLVVRAATAVRKLVETYLTALGSAVLELLLAGSVLAGALYVWLRIARWLVSRRCRELGS